MAKNDFDAPSAIKKVEEANEGVNFDKKLLESVERSIPIQKKIKSLIWSATRVKLLFFLIAVIFLLGSNFLIGFVQ